MSLESFKARLMSRRSLLAGGGCVLLAGVWHLSADAVVGAVPLARFPERGYLADELVVSASAVAPKGLGATAHGFFAARRPPPLEPTTRWDKKQTADVSFAPIAHENIRLPGDDLVRLQLKRPFSDGTFALDLDPLSLLLRLAATVPPPHFHSVRYAGVLAPASKWRVRVVPPPPRSLNPATSTMTARPARPRISRLELVGIVVDRPLCSQVIQSPRNLAPGHPVNR